MKTCLFGLEFNGLHPIGRIDFVRFATVKLFGRIDFVRFAFE